MAIPFPLSSVEGFERKEFALRIHIFKWRHRVNYHCRHAMYNVGIRTVRDLGATKIVDLLRLAQTDANDVATIMTVVLESNLEGLHPNFSMSKQELADVVDNLCENNNLDHKKLMEITVEEMLTIEGLDQATIPPIIRKIKHIMLGKPDPAELLKEPALPQTARRENGWWEEPADATWIEQDIRDGELLSNYLYRELVTGERISRHRLDDFRPHKRSYYAYS